MPKSPKPKIALFTLDFHTSDQCIRLLNSIPENQIDLIAILKNSPDENTSKLEKIISTRPDIKFIKSKTNLGISKGWNHLINKFPDFDAFIFCGSDVIFDHHTIPNLIQAWQQLPNPNAFLFPPLFDLDSSGQKTNHLQFAAHQKLQGTSPISTQKGSFHCFLIPKTTLKITGLFDPNLLVFSEDTEFYHRLKTQKIPMFLVPQTKIWHPAHDSFSTKTSDFLTLHRIKSKLILEREHPKFKSLNFRFYLLSKLIQSLFLFRFSTFKIILQAISESKTHQILPIPNFPK